MHAEIGSCRLELLQGDIVLQRVDAIVTAANAGLAGGGGVDAAVHRAAGPELLVEARTRYPQGCDTGSAAITSAGRLPAKFVIHAVGPIWQGGLQRESDYLTGAYRRSLELAVENGCESIAFPAISCGIYGYPRDLAAEIAISTICDFLAEKQAPKRVLVVLFDMGTWSAFASVLESKLAR